MDEGILANATSACVALVPVVTTAQWKPVPDQQPSRADFVAHLIAAAEHVPQTRTLRRATPAEAQNAYRAIQVRGAGMVQDAGIRTQQII